jgi:arabinose-5-phosphate isomerase
MGDALALTAMQVKGVTREAFAANHPSGQLGRRLTLRVRDVVQEDERTPRVGPDVPLLDALSRITDGGLGAVTVVDSKGLLLGIITDGDVRRALERAGPADIVNLCAEDVMTPDPVVVGPDAMAYEALRLMEDRPSQIAVLPVVDEGRSVGLLRLHDLVRMGL